MKIIASPNAKQNWAALGSRKGQLWLLIIMSALTMTVPYFIQGALSGGLSPAQIAPNVWELDQRAWAIRAVVEGLVIAYISRTSAKTRWQGATLWALEIALIALIAVTLGPTLYAAMNGTKMTDALGSDLQWWWAFGLASYMPLMVLGASYAYRVQPDDAPMQTDASAEVAELSAKVAELEYDAIKRINKVAELEGIVASAQSQLALRDKTVAGLTADATQHAGRVAELERIVASDKENAQSLRADATGLQTELAEAQQNATAMQTQLTAMQTAMKAVDAWTILPPTAKARWIVQHTNGDRPAATELAKVLNCSLSTVTRVYNEAAGGAK